ncbi:MAG: tyrosine-type recombinase/integrase [Verrucomicrobiota bacterium]
MAKWSKTPYENLVKLGDIYYINAHVGGRKVRRSLKTTVAKVAKIKRDTLLAKLKAGATRTGRETWTLAHACAVSRQHVEDELSAGKLKPNSAIYRRERIVVLEKTLPRRPLSSWTRRDMVQWWTGEKMCSYAASTRNGTLVELHHMIKLAVSAGAMLEDVSEDIERAPIMRKEKRIPSEDEYHAIVAEIAKQRTRYAKQSAQFVQFLASCGCRPTEAFWVHERHVADGFISIYGGPDGTKNSKPRQVPVIASLAKLLESLKPWSPQRYLFAIKTPKVAIRGACRRLGLPQYAPYDMRHLFATRCIESGVDIPTVSRWLGHQDGGALAMKTYGHLRDEHSLAAAKRVHF